MNGSKVLEIIEDKSLFKPYGYINGEWISSEKEKSFLFIIHQTEKLLQQCQRWE